MDNITVVILTKNEEENICSVIKNAQKVANEVLIVDSGSLDETVELAKMLAHKLFIVHGIMIFLPSAILL